MLEHYIVHACSLVPRPSLSAAAKKARRPGYDTTCILHMQLKYCSILCLYSRLDLHTFVVLSTCILHLVVRQVGVPLLEEKLSSITIPDISGTSHIKIFGISVGVDYWLTK